MEVQTRSEAHGIRFFPTVKDAMLYALKDPSVWKISFSLPNGERVRLIREMGEMHDTWMYEPLMEDIACTEYEKGRKDV